MAGQLKGRVALVTGAGRGIGRAIALGLSREGASLALVSRTRSELDGVANEINRADGCARAFTVDVAQENDVQHAVNAAVEQIGPIDILINNAGHNVIGPLEGSDPAVWWRQIEVNVRGPYLFSRAVLGRMRERKWGRIVNISSSAGLRGSKYNSAYCAAKHALVGMTRALSFEVAGTGVTVNTFRPGLVETALTKSTMSQRSVLLGAPVETLLRPGGLVLPEEVVPSILFLLSEGAALINGEDLGVKRGDRETAVG
ncbi:MAG: SDR family NAD(P)-dependent oxidoreductase [Myxococcaceae bacterium]